MDFTYPPEAEALRTEIRAWLDANLTDEIQANTKWSMEPGAEGLERLHAWNRILADARYTSGAYSAVGAIDVKDDGGTLILRIPVNVHIPSP